MPEMDGLDLCYTLGQITPDRYIYFIFLTSGTTTEMLHAFQHGADDFLSKPIVAIKLHARLTAAARLLDTQRKLKVKNRQVRAALCKTQALNNAMIKICLPRSSYKPRLSITGVAYRVLYYRCFGA